MPDKSRRAFISTSIKVGASLSMLGSPLISKGLSFQSRHLKILILGGTSFLGPHQIAYAMGRGHSISTFTRGRTKPTLHQELFKDVEQLIGDREDDLEALKNRKWDAVIDNSGRRVKWTKDTSELLRDNVERYLYTSSTGVYYPYLNSDIKEETKLVLKVPGDIDETQKMEYGYGVMKANSEIETVKGFGLERSIIVRPTYMMGPGDRTDRFTYWPVRLSKGGEVLVPGKSSDPVQYIDVRDVAAFMIQLIENKIVGTFNAVGPVSPTAMEAFVYGAHAAFSSKASFTIIDDYEFLTSQNVPYAIPWIMPTGDNFGSARVNNTRAIKNGLIFTPLAQSVYDIEKWWNSDVVTPERREKMYSGSESLMSREKAILTAWKQR